MTTVWKVLLGLALVVPMGAYVMGSLVASSTAPVAQQSAVVVPGPTTGPRIAPGTEFVPRPEARPDAGSGDGSDDGSDDGSSGGGPTVDDNGVEVVTPQPRPVPPPAGGDDDDDDDDDRDDDDDDEDDDDDDDGDDDD